MVVATAMPVHDTMPDVCLQIPGYDCRRDSEGYYYDADAAQLAIDFFAQMLTHVKGKIGPFVLEPWQEAIVRNIYGWKRLSDGLRRYREVFIFVPRKNGKTMLCAGLVLFMLVADGEIGPEIYSAAADREQAALIYLYAKGMVLGERMLREKLKIHKTSKSIVWEETNGLFKAISSEAKTKHGFNTHCAVIDELHAHPNANLVEVLMTSIGSRSQPLIVHITTSDFERPNSICNDKHKYASKVRDGKLTTPQFLPVIYEASIEDDWTSEEVWEKANPNIDISIDREYLRTECQRAKDWPAYENTFKRLHLNIRTQQKTLWLPMEKWDACKGELPDLEGEDCFCGLDLGSTRDLTAFVMVFPDVEGYPTIVKPLFFAPKDRAIERQERDGIPYLDWERDGLLELTAGNVTDYDFIRHRIGQLRSQYNIQNIAVDTSYARQLITQLTERDGLSCTEFAQNMANYTAPTKEVERLILSCQLLHDGNAVMDWMASNVAVKTDENQNIRPIKDSDGGKIDGIIGLVMAVAGVMTARGMGGVFEERGIYQL